MEQDQLFRQAEEAVLTARKLVEEARALARKSREQRLRVRRFDQPLFWFSEREE